MTVREFVWTYIGLVRVRFVVVSFAMPSMGVGDSSVRVGVRGLPFFECVGVGKSVIVVGQQAILDPVLTMTEVVFGLRDAFSDDSDDRLLTHQRSVEFGAGCRWR